MINKSIVTPKRRAEYAHKYKRIHKMRFRYLTSRSNARTFFRKYIKPSDLPEFEKWIAKCKKRFASQKGKSR